MGVWDGELHGGYAATLDSRASSRMTIRGRGGKKTHGTPALPLFRHSRRWGIVPIADSVCRRGRRPKAGIQGCGSAKRERNGCVGRQTAWRLRRHSGFPSKLENDGKKTSRAMTTLIPSFQAMGVLPIADSVCRRGRRPKAGIQAMGGYPSPTVPQGCGSAKRERNGCVGRRTAWRLRRHSGFPGKLENDGIRGYAATLDSRASSRMTGYAATPPLWIPEQARE